ncbi:ABC transporter substrate-binding protein [Zhihengliuella flava]|uniref:NitT/TauT family transport system substrate-binding protein n=1 Tax=Zhihengliuella flava TaxID=1285193 RepID=A0A931GER3_9MICC|nr:ABC transporter substrate-binding protein [Zhihengliuella flava]MBG6084410.1 NitT/TauT family transport system substrate-binding protein [Zhihengliuella flava]
MNKRIVALGSVLALGAALTACGADEPAAEGEMTTLSVGTIGIGSDAAIALGVEQGYFEEEGLQIETSVVANPPAGIAAAQSGQMDITYTPSIPLLNGLSQSVDLQILAAADGYPADAADMEDKSQVDDTGLYAAADSGIESAADLEGKSVAVPARNAQLEVTIANSIQNAGGDPSTVNWMVLDFSSALQSLEQGRIDAAGLVSPFTSNAAESGHQLIASPGVEFFGPGAVGLWVASGSFAEDNPEAAAGFVRAINKSNEYANNNFEEALDKAAELTKVDRAVIEAGADTYWPTEVTEESISAVNTSLVELGYLESEVELDDNLIYDAP